MRVLIVHNRYQQRGGEDHVVDDEVALLRHRGHEVRSLFEDNQGLDAMPAWRQVGGLWWSRDSAARVRQVVQDFRPEVMHVHNTHARLSPAVFWAAQGCAVPMVQTLHNYRLLCVNAMLLRDGRPCEDCVGHLPWRGALHGCYRGSVSRSTAMAVGITLHRTLGSHTRHVQRFIALSEHAKRTLVRGGLPTLRVVVKPNFTTDPLDPAAVFSSVGNPASRRGRLYVGRLSEEKGLEWLMKASALARHRITVMGSGPMAAACQAHPWFDCLGEQPTDKVFAAMQQARALVLPSLSYEAMPRVLVEALACGLPIVASQIGALAELVEPGGTGWLVPPGDVQALARAMADAQDHADWRLLSCAARDAYQSKYTSDAAHDALMAVYHQAIEQHAADRA